MEREYVVTLINYDDLEEFYDDMETPGGNLYIPGRVVECALRRDISRNTHYLLTPEEAETVKKDPRVLSCELLPQDRGIITVPYWEQTGNFEKSSSFNSSDKNWGLLRCVSGVQSSGWGVGGATTQKTSFTIKTTSSGKNVDVVIVDAHVNPNHPEFMRNPDGSGGGRVNTINWFQYNSYVGVSGTNTYDYSNFSSNHGTHVAGTVSGNTQGWARDSNIYTIEFNYSSSPVSQWDLILFDYIRAFHRNKPVNPATGRRNPTITNNSWGYSYGNLALSDITSVTYRGLSTDISSASVENKKILLEERGVPVPFNTYLYRTPARVSALDADIQDAINEGIIVISSAGNSYWQCSNSISPDYNNSIIIGGQTINHSRGSSPSAANNVICVGSIGQEHVEKKAPYSNWGSRIDIWAPGSNIISCVYNSSAASEFGVTLVDDPRSSSFKLASISGTSMSCPQVTGVVACLMEQEQDLRQADVREYLSTRGSKLNNINLQEPNADWVDAGSKKSTQSPYTSLSYEDNNKFLFYNKERQLTGSVMPKNNHKRRPSSGMAYPRQKGRR